MKIALSSGENNGIGICSDRKMSDKEYTDDLVLLSEGPSKLRVFLYSLNDRIDMSEMSFSSSKYAMVLQG